jgi:hypothetical protein
LQQFSVLPEIFHEKASPAFHTHAVIPGTAFAEYHSEEWGLKHFVHNALVGNWLKLGYESASDFAKSAFGDCSGWYIRLEDGDNEVIISDGNRSSKKRASATDAKEEQRKAPGKAKEDKSEATVGIQNVVHFPGNGSHSDTTGMNDNDLMRYREFMIVNMDHVHYDIRHGRDSETKKEARGLLKLVKKVSE